MQTAAARNTARNTAKPKRWVSDVQKMEASKDKPEGEYFGFPKSLFTSIESRTMKKTYGDTSKVFTTLALPDDFSVMLSTANIVDFVNSGIEASKLLLRNYQSLFKFYTKMKVNYPVELDVDFFKELTEHNTELPAKLNISHVFEHIDKRVSFSQDVSYMFSRFMMPQEINESLVLGTSGEKATWFKESYLEVFNNCLKAWVKLSPFADRDKADSTQTNITRLLMLFFVHASSPNDLLYKIAYAILVNNATVLAASLNNDAIDPKMFNVINMDKYTVEQFNAVITELRTHSENEIQKLLADYLVNILKFKTEEAYPLHKLDEDNRSKLLFFISSNLMDVFTKAENLKKLSLILNSLLPFAPSRPLGMTPIKLNEFNTFPREMVLNYIFDTRIVDNNVNSFTSKCFPLLKHYFYNDATYKDILFKKWTSIDYYKCYISKATMKSNVYSLFQIFLEWCLFIDDNAYTKALFSIIANAPMDGRMFVVFNTDKLAQSEIITTMKNGGVVKDGVVYVPSFKDCTEAVINIHKLFVNFYNGVINPKTNEVIVPPITEDKDITSYYVFALEDNLKLFN